MKALGQDSVSLAVAPLAAYCEAQPVKPCAMCGRGLDYYSRTWAIDLEAGKMSEALCGDCQPKWKP